MIVALAFCTIGCGTGNILNGQTGSLEGTGCTGRLAEIPDGSASAEAGESTARILCGRRATRARVEGRR